MALVVGTVTAGIATDNLGGGRYGTGLHTVAADTTVLILVVAHSIGSGDPTLTAQWNGVEMTRLVQDLSGGFGPAAAVFLLKNPDIGNFEASIASGGASAGNSPWIGLMNLSGAKSRAGGTRTATPGLVTVQGAAGLIIDVAIGDTQATVGTPTGTGVGTKITMWNNNVISAADRTGAMYVTHAGSDITTAYTGDILTYVAVEIIEGSDFTPQIAII